MTSSIQLLVALKVALERAVAAGDWPPAAQGDNGITLNLAKVDLAVWNEAYIGKLLVEGGTTETVDLRNFTDLLFESGKLMDAAFLLAMQVALVDSAFPDASIQLKPGATNGFQWFFTSPTEGVELVDGQLMLFTCQATDIVGTVLDGTHKTLDFENPGADDIIATVIVIGGV